MKKKIFIAIAAIVVICVVGYLITAYVMFQKNNEKFGQKLTYNSATSDYTLTTDDEIYYYAPYAWWKIGGNIGITSRTRYDENNQQINESYSATIDISKSEYIAVIAIGYEDDEGEIKKISYQLNEKMELVDADSMSTVQEAMFESLKPRILEVYKKIYDMWGIFNPDEVST